MKKFLELTADATTCAAGSIPSGKAVVINIDFISAYVEHEINPDRAPVTRVSVTNGNWYQVKESVEEIKKRIAEYQEDYQ